ncbi:hypothetical protein [Neisseria gonorrhoeae]
MQMPGIELEREVEN